MIEGYDVRQLITSSGVEINYSIVNDSTAIISRNPVDIPRAVNLLEQN